jgi:hypothetical protein
MKGIFEKIRRGSLGTKPYGQNLKQTKAIAAMMVGTVSMNAVAVWPCESTFIVAFNIMLTPLIAEAIMSQSRLLIASNTLMERRAVQIVEFA